MRVPMLTPPFQNSSGMKNLCEIFSELYYFVYLIFAKFYYNSFSDGSYFRSYRSIIDLSLSINFEEMLSLVTFSIVEFSLSTLFAVLSPLMKTLISLLISPLIFCLTLV